MSVAAYGSHPAESSTSEALNELALDLRWSYKHSADKIWEQLDPDLWEATHNPWIVLQTVSRQRLASVTADPNFQQLVTQLHREKVTSERSQGWFQRAHPNAGIKTIAYFSMEFMLSEALPIYSGGLGNVAGDQLKAASNLSVPVTAVGLLYQQGYFRQEINRDGRQEALYPFNDPGQLPITPSREANGEWLRLALDFPGVKLWIRVWEVKVGRARLYLLDTNDPANIPSLRGITSQLYGGDSELRLKQEKVLGIGGWRLFKALGLAPEVCHLNEGHAAFAVLERARSYMTENKVSFEAALTTTRAGNLFTTHTPVEAGFDRFRPELMWKHFRAYAEELEIPFDELMALGRKEPRDSAEPFNMAFLAFRGSGSVNGVSRLHGQVSRRIFQELFPRWPEAEVPVTYVTNGVHMPTWDSEYTDEFWEKACGKGSWYGPLAKMEQEIKKVGDGELWQLRMDGRTALVEYARKQHMKQIARRGGSPEEIVHASNVLDPDTLTIGFARRFATYKRPNLLLQDTGRLVQILTNANRPVQLVLAGKAHPADFQGQEMIRQWMEFVYRPEVRQRVVFLTDYDVFMAGKLVQGVDVWLNTPRRPWEASGTSGMKVLVNGGLNLSELDGWWAEAYSPELGWAIGDGKEHGDDPNWDRQEAEAVYSLLEREIIPQFYTRDEHGIPRAWIARIRESMSRLTPQFSTNRVVRQYTEEHYLQAAAAYGDRASKHGSLGSEILQWRKEIEQHWDGVHFGSATVEQKNQRYLFRVQVFVDDLNPDAIAVELYAEGKDGESVVQRMNRSERLAGSANAFAYSAEIPATRAIADFTPRVVPYHSKALVPLEAPFILWHDSPGWK
jgi:glycogen phosphorylase